MFVSLTDPKAMLFLRLLAKPVTCSLSKYQLLMHGDASSPIPLFISAKVTEDVKIKPSAGYHAPPLCLPVALFDGKAGENQGRQAQTKIEVDSRRSLTPRTNSAGNHMYYSSTTSSFLLRSRFRKKSRTHSTQGLESTLSISQIRSPP